MGCDESPNDGMPRDPVREAGFPTVEQFRRGVILNCIAHSFWLSAQKSCVFTMDWDDHTYFEDDMQGEHWAVCFSEAGAVAVFYTNESDRNPFPEGSPPYDQSRYVSGIPRHLEPTRDLALSQMYDFDFGHGDPARAVITAAMWSDGERFTSNEPWQGVYDNSGWALCTHLLPQEEALRRWWQGMGFPHALARAVWSLYERRIASAAPVIPVERQEWQAFLDIAGGDAGKAVAAEDLLAGVGITLGSYLDSTAV